MNNPLVSVIMPAYNAEKYITDSINSVIAQTYTEWEIIVIDDGSTDNTSSVVKKITEKDNRVKYIYQENGRQGKARNNGIRHSQGEYIAFLDADDLWVPEKVRIQVELLQTKKMDLVFSDSYIFEDKPEITTKLNIIPGSFQGEKDFSHFLSYNRIPILTVMTTRKSVEQVEGFSEENEIQNAEDLNLWLKLLLAGNTFLGIDMPLTYYRIHSSSSTAGDRHVILPILEGLKKLARIWPGYNNYISDSFFFRINTFFIQNNIANRELIVKLLQIRNKMTKKQLPVSWWKMIHTVFGKRIFRYLFTAYLKMRPDRIVNRDIKEIQF
jgi:glycosyltransferase involved in cell wall biosynthesis